MITFGVGNSKITPILNKIGIFSFKNNHLQVDDVYTN